MWAVYTHSAWTNAGVQTRLLTRTCPPSLKVAAVTNGLESISWKGAGGAERCQHILGKRIITSPSNKFLKLSSEILTKVD